MGRDVLIERHLVGAMPPTPETVAVARLVHGDPVDPRAQAGLPAESLNGAEDAQEDFLGQVERFVAIPEEVHRELDDHPLVLGNQFGAGHLLARGAPLHEHCFPAADLRPLGDARLLHRDFHYSNVRHRVRPKVPAGW